MTTLFDAPAQFYFEVRYEDYEYENGDGSYTTDHLPYWAVRVSPNGADRDRSHEIGVAHSEEYAAVIVAALNGEAKRHRRRRPKAAA